MSVFSVANPEVTPLRVGGSTSDKRDESFLDREQDGNPFCNGEVWMDIGHFVDSAIMPD